MHINLINRTSSKHLRCLEKNLKFIKLYKLKYNSTNRFVMLKNFFAVPGVSRMAKNGKNFDISMMFSFTFLSTVF